MAFVSIPSADIAAGKPVDVDLMANIKDNDDALYASASGALFYDLPNGDMEITATAWPANWYDSSGVAGYTAYPGGTGSGIETTAPLYASQSMRFTHPGGAGNGGGYSDSEYMPCRTSVRFRLTWIMRSTVTGIKNQVILRWFDEDKVACATPTTTVYDSVANPTAGTELSAIGDPPSGARFYKVRLIGGENSVDVAGDTFYDGVKIERVGISNSQTFTSSGTFTVPAGIERVFATLQGGGGGGGGSNFAGDGGGGGAAGEHISNFPLSVTSNAAMAVTIGVAGAAGAVGSTGGTGGDTVFGGLTASGGVGGSGASGGTDGVGGIARQGVGNSGSGGNQATSGENTAFYNGGAGSLGGGGGASLHGAGGAGAAASNNNGGAASGNGSGGGGASGTATTGGVGTKGKVVIFW